MADYFSRPVICNTGPVLGLSRAGLSRLLTEVFPAVIIPEIVADELSAKRGADAAQVAALLQRAKIHRLATEPDPLLLADLDAGEAAVILTARETGISGVVIDERKARRIAAAVYHLEVKGTCALLLEAKRRSLIQVVAPALDAMIKAGYYVGPAVQAECLARAGE